MNREGHVGPCGHGSDESAGPCQCCVWLDVSQPARATAGLTVVRGWAVPDHTSKWGGEGRWCASAALGAFAFPFLSPSHRRPP